MPVDDPKISQVLQVSKCPCKSEKATLRVSGEAETPPQKHRRIYTYLYLKGIMMVCVYDSVYTCVFHKSTF